MDFAINDKIALVLGAGGGLGSAIAASLAREGCRLVLADVNENALKQVHAEIEAGGGRAMALHWDIADLSVVDARVGSIEERLGPVDILVNNTGGPAPSLASDTQPETWSENFDKMVLPVIKISSRVLPAMRRRGWGRIITSTSSGVVNPIANLAVSNGLRSALVAWSKTLAREVAREGVTVNIVVPGRIATARVRSLDEAKAKREGRTVDEVAARSADDIPVGRYGKPGEYADVVTFLASGSASYVTGSIIRVDGGLIPSI